MIKDLEYRTEVSEVAWQWEAPKETSRVEVFPVPGGVAALLEDGVVALSGENGGRMWEFRVSGSEAFGALAGGGRYFALQLLDPNDEATPPRMVVLDTETGKPIQDYILTEGDSSSGRVRGGLRNVTSEHWITVDGDGLTAFRLGSDQRDWSVSDLAQCEETGSIDRLVTVEKVAVAAVTCYEQPDGEDPVKMTEGQEFVSGFVGIDAATGEELWRTEEQVGMFPADSMERGVATHESGLVTAYYPYEGTGQVVDPLTGETTLIEEGRVLWTSDDGSLLGVWNTRTGAYRQQDRSGGIRAGSSDNGVGTAESLVNAWRGEPLAVGLEDGVIRFAEEVTSGEEANAIAVFQGFDDAVPVMFEGDEETLIKVRNARSVPGAVVLSYTDFEGRSGVIGLH
ncbi:PQQ-binding-like beta-propeller repeat protein [Nocardiopsis sp. ATB16-24]|uniref:PQQ-binding-like beta-propeller repeat protein n=1 Tax=Nocardiopsis sp. ATB16-24 TaxID=3019555 RepID=UPI0025577A5D|nr:PQQ-binding-like beta-propeller repeat protein [Nocardiopsis sp. ATB16-24]